MLQLNKLLTTGCCPRFLNQMVEPAKKPRLTKEEKKLIRKSFALQKKRERKRNEDYLIHYENSDFSDYYFENGMRKVYPYTFVFKAFAKLRWINRSISDVLSSEFGLFSQSLISSRCESGDLKVNDCIVTPDYILKISDLISHKLHRHEHPVLDTPIKFIYEDDDTLVLSKPASIPVHPCGQYMLNSVVHILAKEHGYRSLRFVHRLDRMTSGILITSKNYDSSFRLATQISDREVKKFYICEVDGYFQDSHPDCPGAGSSTGIVECCAPLGAFNPRLGLNAVIPEDAGGKPCRTHFVRLSYNPERKTSLVLCRLFTGRTHQIRVHLQYLGHPIVGDPLYNSAAWGEKKGMGGEYSGSSVEIAERLTRASSSYTNWQPKNDSENSENLFEQFCSQLERSTLDQATRERLLKSFDSDCPVCGHSVGDPERNQMILKLHSYRYTGSDWSYTAPLPDWVLDSPTELSATIEEYIQRLSITTNVF